MDSAVKIHSEVIAALSMIGGIDSRLRIGGLVTSDLMEGQGTVCRVSQSGKLVVQLNDSLNQKKLSIGNCKSFPQLQFDLERMPINESSLDTWGNLLGKFFNFKNKVYLARRENNFSYFCILAYTTTNISDNRHARSVPAFVNSTLLRSQQHQLAAIKACRQLFRHQRILRKILKQPSVEMVLTLEALNEGEDVETSSEQFLLQRMMLKATQPSPLKAIFCKEELEVSIYYINPTLK